MTKEPENLKKIDDDCFLIARLLPTVPVQILVIQNVEEPLRISPSYFTMLFVSGLSK